jgi:hypothetical protein
VTTVARPGDFIGSRGSLSGRLRGDPHAECTDNLRHRLEARIAIRGKRLVKADPGDASGSINLLMAELTSSWSCAIGPRARSKWESSSLLLLRRHLS